ncbi:MAG: hypothetical protein AAF985_16400, partial [Bacteroidota bacterium]
RGKGGAFNWYMETVLVWVWCWELYPDFDIGASNGTNGGGSNSNPYVPVYWEDVKELQDCFALNDVFDIDPNSGGNSNSTFTGDVDLCSKWNDYVETCLTDIQQTSATVYFSWEEYDSPYHYWGQFKEENPELFNEIINGDHGCVRTKDLDSFTEEPPVDEEEYFQSSESVRLEYGIPLGLWKASGANSCCGDLDCIKEKIGSEEAGSEWPLFFLGENGVYHLWETCPETFEPVRIQSSYTTQVDDTMHSYLSDNITYGDYQIPAMCITHTRFWSTGGFMSKEDAREKLAFSFDKAREFTFFEFNADQSINLKETFKYYLTTMLKGQFGGQPTVNFVPCAGNISGNLNQFQVAWNGTCVHYYD